MYRRVLANLNWETPSKRDTFKNDLATKLSSVPAFDENIRHGEDVEGNPQSSVDCRPENDVDADDLYAFIKSKIDKIPALKGRVTIHDCEHDSGPPFKPCSIDREYEV